MRIDASTFGILPNGEEEATVVLWPGHEERTIPVWLAIQILINRVASSGGGEVFLPAASQNTTVAFGRLRSYNIGAHRLVIPSSVTLSGEASPDVWRNMDYSPYADPGYVHFPHGTTAPWVPVNVEATLWQDRGDPPQSGTIIEFTGTEGPAIHVFRAKHA